MPKRRPLRDNPITTTSATGFSLVGLLTTLGTDPKVIAVVSFALAAIVAGFNYVVNNGGFAALWDRVIHGGD